MAGATTSARHVCGNKHGRIDQAESRIIMNTKAWRVEHNGTGSFELVKVCWSLQEAEELIEMQRSAPWFRGGEHRIIEGEYIGSPYGPWEQKNKCD